VIQLGACDDKVTAADTAKLSATAYTGAATYAFIESIERWGTGQTYASLLSHMTATLKTLGKASIKPPTAGSAMASGALPLVGAIALGPLGLLAGLAASTGVGELLGQAGGGGSLVGTCVRGQAGRRMVVLGPRVLLAGLAGSTGDGELGPSIRV
jgi:hypothetical protein